jgi:hypothetical protein
MSEGTPEREEHRVEETRTETTTREGVAPEHPGDSTADNPDEG